MQSNFSIRKSKPKNENTKVQDPIVEYLSDLVIVAGIGQWSGGDHQ